MEQNTTNSQTYNDATQQPQALSQFIILEAHVRNATNLPKMDILGKVDAYAKFLPMDILSPPRSQVSTRVVEKDYHPEWNEILITALSLRFAISMYSHPALQLFDWDKVTSDSVIGKCQSELSFLELIKACAKQAFMERRAVSDLQSLRASSEEAFGHLWQSTNDWLEASCDFCPVVYTMTKQPKPRGETRLHATIVMKVSPRLLDPSISDSHSVATELYSALDRLCQEEIANEKKRKQARVPKLLDWDHEEERVRTLTQRRIAQWIEQVKAYALNDLPDHLQKLYAGTPEEKKKKILTVVADPGIEDQSNQQYQLVSEMWQSHILDTATKEEEGSDGLFTISAVFLSLSEALKWRQERASSHFNHNPEHEHVVLLLAAYPESHHSRKNFDTTSHIHLGRIGDLISSSTTLAGYRRLILFDEERDLYQQLVDGECRHADLSRKFPWPTPPFADIPHPPSDVSCNRMMKLTVHFTGQELYRDTELYVPEGTEGVYFYNLAIPVGVHGSNGISLTNPRRNRPPYAFRINVMPRTRVTIFDCNFQNTLIGVAFATSFTMRDTRVSLTEKYVSPLRLGPLAESHAIEDLPLDHDRCIRKWLADKDEVARMEQLMQEQPMYVSLVGCSLTDQLSQPPHSAIHLSNRTRLQRSSHIRGCSLNGYQRISGDGMKFPIVVDNMNTDSTDPKLLTGDEWFYSDQCARNSNIYEENADWNEFNKGEEAQKRVFKHKIYE